MQGFGQLVVKDKRQFNYLLSALNFCGGILLFHFCIELGSSTYDTIRLTDVYEPSINFSISVLTFFCFRQLIDPGFHLTKKDFFHFTPAGLSLLILASLYILGLNQQLNADKTYHSIHLTITYAFYVISSFWMVFYSLFNLKMGYSLVVEEKSQYPKAKVVLLLLLVEVILLALLMVVGSILMSFLVYKIVCIFAIQLFLTVFFLVQRYPDYVQNMQESYNKARYEKSKISGLDVDSVVKRLEGLMEIEKVYKDNKLSLSRISEALDITTHQLSQILNDNLGCSFPRYITIYRLKAAKKTLLENKNESILSIAFSSGFKSKSSFNASFKKEFNMTPTEYRNLKN